MAFTYPICLKLAQKKCVVVGAGSVALRKVKTLLAQEALVTVVSPELNQELAKEKDKFVWEQAYYREEFLADAFLVIAATDNRAVNHEIAVYCDKHNILVNVIDSPEESSFIVNSYFTKGDLLVAVSTDGASPALSRKIRKDLVAQIADEYADILAIIAEARVEALIKITDEAKRREFLQSLAKIDYEAIIKDKSTATFRDRVKKCLLSYLE